MLLSVKLDLLSSTLWDRHCAGIRVIGLSHGALQTGAAASYAEFIGFHPPSLPHFPSCFCNGFPFDRNGGICREGNSFLPPLLIRIINQNLASPRPRRRSEADMGQYMTRCADRRTDKTAADAAAGAQSARSSSSAHFFKAAGKSI